MPKPPNLKRENVSVELRQVVKFIPPWESGTAGATTGFQEFEAREAYDFRHIHPKTAALRRLFVAEFVKDFNGTGAVLRLGLDYNDPREIASRWLREPFTQHILDKYVQDTEERALVTRNKILAALVREANSYGLDSSSASRVSALGKLAKILGLEIDKSEVKLIAEGGVMVVPMAASVDDWEKNVMNAQAELKAKAKS